LLRYGKDLGHLAEVLRGGGEEEFVICTARTAQSWPTETKHPLEVGEEHLDLLPQLHQQKEWTISSGDLIERTRCVACHKPLPEGHFKFCGSICAGAHQMRLHRVRSAREETALDMAIRSPI
jgi:hypothetical protein